MSYVFTDAIGRPYGSGKAAASEQQQVSAGIPDPAVIGELVSALEGALRQEWGWGNKAAAALAKVRGAV